MAQQLSASGGQLGPAQPREIAPASRPEFLEQNRATVLDRSVALDEVGRVAGQAAFDGRRDVAMNLGQLAALLAEGARSSGKLDRITTRADGSNSALSNDELLVRRTGNASVTGAQVAARTIAATEAVLHSEAGLHGVSQVDLLQALHAAGPIAFTYSDSGITVETPEETTPGTPAASTARAGKLITPAPATASGQIVDQPVAAPVAPVNVVAPTALANSLGKPAVDDTAEAINRVFERMDRSPTQDPQVARIGVDRPEDLAIIFRRQDAEFKQYLAARLTAEPVVATTPPVSPYANVRPVEKGERLDAPEHITEAPQVLRDDLAAAVREKAKLQVAAVQVQAEESAKKRDEENGGFHVSPHRNARVVIVRAEPKPDGGKRKEDEVVTLT